MLLLLHLFYYLFHLCYYYHKGISIVDICNKTIKYITHWRKNLLKKVLVSVFTNKWNLRWKQQQYNNNNKRHQQNSQCRISKEIRNLECIHSEENGRFLERKIAPVSVYFSFIYFHTISLLHSGLDYEPFLEWLSFYFQK